MADWIVIDDDDKLNPGGFYRNNFNFRHGFEDMENCDLPPPIKVYEGLEKTIVVPPLPPTLGNEEDHGGDRLEKEKWELSKALRLSQSRARKAERMVEVLSKELNGLSKLLIQESMESFADKQWLKVMEFRISKLENQLKNGSKSMAWFVAVALCLGIAAGFGVTIFGYTYIF